MHIKKLAVFLLSFILSTSLILLYSNYTRAIITSCSVSVNTSSLSGGSSSQLVFHITNNDEEGKLLYWVKVTSPSSSFTITSGDGPNLGGVSVAEDGSYVILNTSLSTGEGGDYNVGVTTSNTDVSASSFTVTTSDSSDGTDATTCSGDTSVSISANTSSILTISNIQVSASDTSATINWNTSGNTTGYVDYGSSSSYGSQVADTNSSTSHSVNITGLSASSTYYFRITSQYGSSSAQSSDANFSTAATGSTVTKTVTTTTNTVTVKEVEVKDTTPPTVSIKNDIETVYSEPPEIVANTKDQGGIAKIIYSTDAGRSWLAIRDFDIGKSNIDFSFVPNIYDDGSYEVLIEVTDSSGNKKQSKPVVIVIDRLAPQIGGVVFSVGSQLIQPNKDGTVDMVSGITPKITFSAVGGPDTIDLDLNGKSISAHKNLDNGLWSAELIFDEVGQYDLNALSVDGANNSVNQTISRLNYIKKGQIKDNGFPTRSEIKVFSFDAVSQRYVLWNAKDYSQSNPFVTADDGTYSLLLPAGSYYISIKSEVSGREYKSEIFHTQKNTAITSQIELGQKSLNIFGVLNIPLPDIFSPKINVDIDKKNESKSDDNVIKNIPYFKLGDFDSNELKGNYTVLSVLSRWHPETASQLLALNEVSKDNLIVPTVIFTQQSNASISLYQKQGKYNFRLVADPDGELNTILDIKNMPTHFIIDRKGNIVFTKYGLISSEDILGYFDDI